MPRYGLNLPGYRYDLRFENNTALHHNICEITTDHFIAAQKQKAERYCTRVNSRWLVGRKIWVFLETKEYQLFEVKEVQPVYVSVCSLTLTNEKSASFKASGVVAGAQGAMPPPRNWDLSEMFGNFTVVGKTSRSSA